MRNADKGFSLLELLIVVAIILIIATIAIPNLLRARQAANESAAVAQLRTIVTAEVTYFSGAQNNAGNIAQLMGAGLIDGRFGGTMSGYNYDITASGADYTATATPASASTGRFGYYTTPDAVIRFSTVA